MNLKTVAMKKAPLVLMILDGWGKDPHGVDDTNAILQAKTPNLDRYMAQYPVAELETSGPAVGLPAGTMGNSEVGHQNIGAGRRVDQSLQRINVAVVDGVFQNDAFDSQIKASLDSGVPLQIWGLISPGGVHSHTDHLYGMLRRAKELGQTNVMIHAVMDGRDTPPSSGKGYMQELLTQIESIGVGQIATISGRFYAMDRDNRWDRVEKAYDALVNGKGKQATDPLQAIEAAYQDGKTDEFIDPIVLMTSNGDPRALIGNDSQLFTYNYRADRARELTMAFTFDDQSFSGFDRGERVTPNVVTMTEYKEGFPVTVAFGPVDINNTLGELISKAGLSQLRIAETEKYAHVTFFLNGGKEDPFEGEQRILVPSPNVETYDLQPAMNAPIVGDKLVEALASNQYDLVVVNFANPDMVGHTGVLSAAIKALEAVDQNVGKVVEQVLSQQGSVMITADHGNAERMFDPEKNEPFTAHTTFNVPVVLVGQTLEGLKLRENGALADIAPTLIDMGHRLGGSIAVISQPEEMTGESMIVNKS